MDAPTAEPARLQAGDTIAWRISLPEYPASDGWALSYRFTNAGAKFDLTTVADGDAHAVNIAAATSATWPPGDYAVIRTVARAGERHTLAPMSIAVLADWVAATGPVDARGSAQRALEDLRSALRQWLATSGHVQEYQIAGRQMRFASADEIRKRISLAEADARNEQAAQGLTSARPRRVHVRF